MNFIDHTALSITNFIRSNNPAASSEKVLFYALCQLINSLVSIITTLFICAITGHIIDALIAILSFLTIRFVSGGAHMTTSIGCSILSIVILTFSVHASFSYFPIGVILDILSIVILFRNAPQGIKNMSRIDIKFYPLLKVIALSLVLINFIFQLQSLSIIYCIAAVLTTKLGYQVIHTLGRRLNI
jgi:accessory gene regulator B